jgi:hypothetical protein
MAIGRSCQDEPLARDLSNDALADSVLASFAGAMRPAHIHFMVHLILAPEVRP